MNHWTGEMFGLVVTGILTLVSLAMLVVVVKKTRWLCGLCRPDPRAGTMEEIERESGIKVIMLEEKWEVVMASLKARGGKIWTELADEIYAQLYDTGQFRRRTGRLGRPERMGE